VRADAALLRGAVQPQALAEPGYRHIGLVWVKLKQRDDVFAVEGDGALPACGLFRWHAVSMAQIKCGEMYIITDRERANAHDFD
jgi:hypothetical protein